MKKKILVIDDESGFTHMLKLALSDYEILEENDPERAIGTARKFKPDLILLDVIMPKLDGGDLASRIGADPLLAGTPIVFLTAVVSEQEAAGGARNIGGFPFMAKPVNPERLKKCIEEHLLVT